MSTPISLSIIVPAYNVQAYIEESVASIAHQIRPDHELIIVDDGSSDQTPDILARLQRQHPQRNINIIRQANLGVAAARNRGLAAASGAYIAFVDSDDILLPGSLAAICAVIDAHAPDAIACDLAIWHTDRGDQREYIKASYPPRVLIDSRETILNVFFQDRHMYVWTKIFKREIYQKMASPVFPSGRVFEDVTVVPKLLIACDNLYYLPRCIIDYRQRPASISKVVSDKAYLDLATALLPAKQLFQEARVTDSIKLNYDIAVCHLFLSVMKDSYQLPWAAGQNVRRQVKLIFADSLFNQLQTVLDAVSTSQLLEDGTGRPCRAAGSRQAKLVRDVRQALFGSVLFAIRQTVGKRVRAFSRKLRAAPLHPNHAQK